MTDAGFFRGTSAEQDNRFSDKEKKLLKQMRFGENVCKKVDMSKVKVDVLRPWISKRVEDLLGMEDDVVEEFVVNQLEANQFPDGRRIQINLTGFLNGKNARIFTAELWDMLLSAQEQSTGIPSSILESKQEEIKKRNEEQEKLNETLKKTVSRFNDKLKNERDSSPPLPSARSADLPSSSPPNRSNIKREKTSPEPLMSKDLDAASTTINRRKDDGGRRNYRARRSSSPSPTRRSRSRSRDRDRDRRDFRRDRDRDRSPPFRGGGGDRRRDRSRSPIKARRSPMTASRPSYRDNRSRSRDRDRDRDSRPSAPISSNRRFSDFRDRERDNRPSRDMMDRDRRRSRSREDRDRNRGPQRRDAENGSSSMSHFRHPPSPPQQQHSRNSSREKEVRRFAPAEDDTRGPRRAPSNDKEVQMEVSRRKERSPPPAEPMEEENSDHSGDSAQEDSPVAKKSKKDKKSKKEKKKHKKHKKVKKSKKSKNGNASGSDDDDDDEDNSASEDDANGTSSSQRRASSSNLLKYVDATGGIQPSSDDLERKLREKALESLKKANSR